MTRRAASDIETQVREDDSKGRPGPDQPRQPERLRRKRDAEAKRALADALARVSDKEFSRLPIPPEVKEAIVLARNISAHGGRRRQLQFVAKLMRSFDMTETEQALENTSERHHLESMRHRAVEQWRERLLSEGEPAMKALSAEHPRLDEALLRRLVDRARWEHAQDAAPRAFRELFQVLQKIVSG